MRHRNPGIYEIVHNQSGKRYIGSSVDMADRWGKHLSELRRGMHPCKPLQNAVNRYGIDAFTFRVLEHVGDVAELLSREQWYLDNLVPEYNICKVAGSALGRPVSPATRAKLSMRLKGRIMPASAIEKMRLARLGKPLPTAWRAKIGAAHLGRIRPPHVRARISAAKKGRPNGRLGMHLSLETRKKQSDAKKGKPNGLLGTKRPESGVKISAALTGRRLSALHIERIRAIVTGRKQSAATVAKRSAVLRGRHHSEETKQRISAAKRGRPNGLLGRHLTPETRMKLSAAKKGKPSGHLGLKRSAETRARMSDAQRAHADQARQMGIDVSAHLTAYNRNRGQQTDAAVREALTLVAGEMREGSSRWHAALLIPNQAIWL